MVGKPGRDIVAVGLPKLVAKLSPLFVIINGENSAGGLGITPPIADEFFALGADAITLGNHAFNKREIGPYLNTGKAIVRPGNMPAGTPGAGLLHLPAKEGVQLSVANLCGRVYMDSYGDPFALADDYANACATRHLFLDFHAEATSEKIAMGMHMEGRAAAVVGTHTHVTTADESILAGGTAYITDVGMCGPVNSVLGMNRDIILNRFRTTMPQRFEVANEPGVISGVVIDVLRESGQATAIERIKFSQHNEQ